LAATTSLVPEGVAGAVWLRRMLRAIIVATPPAKIAKARTLAVLNLINATQTLAPVHRAAGRRFSKAIG
jgi:hypothetical protein